MFNGKTKALTFSFDDGPITDARLVEILNKYGLRATFNLNSETLGKTMHNGQPMKSPTVKPSDVKFIYEGHEVAAHTLTHPNLTRISDEKEIIRQVEHDRLNLSELIEYEVVGFAYPGGGVNHDDRTAEIIRKNTGIKYCRTNASSYSFDIQTDLYKFNPTVYHRAEFDKMIELGNKFLKAKSEDPRVFYIWGHSYEIDIDENWQKFEEFCSMMSGREDIFYGTNREVLLKADYEV